MPNLTEEGVYTVTCQVTAEGFEPTEVSADVILHGAAADHWTYDATAKTISDGVWVFNVTEKNGELTITSRNAATDLRSDMTLDLTKPIDGGRTIVAITGQIVPSYTTYLTTLVLPETLRSIGNDAFIACSGLKTITPFMPASLTSVANQAFWLCKNLEGDLVLGVKDGPALTLSGQNDFYGTKITSVTIDADLGNGTLPKGIFYSCASLTNVVLRGGVTAIASGAFAGCTKLADLYLNAFVTSWDPSAFSNGPADYAMRLWVDMYGKEWDAWIAENVTAWKDLDAATQALYYANFGAGAKRPVGLVTKEGAQPANQWVLRWYPNGPKPGFMLILK